MACRKTGETKPIFPLVRYCYQGYLTYYYPFGNVPAEDFLENCAKASEPSVLVLGCGDLRSCFYTLWKNFDTLVSTAPKRFYGVSYNLNDRSTAIIARNLVFLSLCLQLPEEAEEKKRFLCAMWAIWYCHELRHDHSDILNSTLAMLIKYSISIEKWSEKGNPLHKLVQFTSSSCLLEVTEVWKMWFNKAIHVESVESMHEARHKAQKGRTGHEFIFATQQIFVFGQTEEGLEASPRVQEAKSYIQEGSCYAEEVIDMKLPRKGSTEVNLTMYERADGTYTCQYNLLPFQGYYHTIEFSAKSIKVEEFTAAQNFIVPSEKFASKPFLANSVQQFSMWIQSASWILNDRETPVRFCFDNRDAISYCQQQMLENINDDDMRKYDVITTSNLIDHVGLPNLVLACVPLLKAEGLLVTSTMKTRAYMITGEEFLRVCFGFKSQLLPVLLGVRCIGYDGELSNPVFIKTSPPDLSNHIKDVSHISRTFLWMKLPALQKLSYTQLPCKSDGNITDALVSAFTSCSFALLNCGPFNPMCFHLCIETALGMLKWLISRLGNEISTYSYWEPLCAALVRSIPPFLHCLQTQMLLHDIHAHLVLAKEDCPLCQLTPLDQYLGLFSADLDFASYKDTSVNFVAYFHRHKQLFNLEKVFVEAQEGKDVYIFDCFDVASCDSYKLRLKFFAPLSFVENGYNVSILMLQKTFFLNRVAAILTTTLKSLQTQWKEYAFYSTASTLKQECVSHNNELFGKVTSHQILHGCKSETELSLSDDTLKALSASKIKTERVSSSSIKLHCGPLSFQLNSSFPINYKKVKIKPSKSGDFITVFCQSQPYSLEEERPCFIVSPDHQLSIVPRDWSIQLLKKHADIQKTQEECNFIEAQPPDKLRTLPMLDVKFFLHEFFQSIASNLSITYYEIHTDSLKCLVVVNNPVFDYNHRTPAVDLAFCFVDNSDKSYLVNRWKSVTGSLRKCFSITSKGWELLKEVLIYFGNRTNATMQRKSKYTLICDREMGSFFTRAVLYYLSIDPDTKTWNIEGMPISSTTQMCACCGKTSPGLLKCTKCQAILYCSQSCEFLHRIDHEKLCDHIVKGLYTLRVHFPQIPFRVAFEKNTFLPHLAPSLKNLYTFFGASTNL